MQAVAAETIRRAVVEGHEFEVVVVVREAEAAGAEPVAQQIEPLAELQVVPAAAVAALGLVEPGADQHFTVEFAVGLHHRGGVCFQLNQGDVSGREGQAALGELRS